MRIKKWLLERFLPMWAKETVLKENRYLRLELHRIQEENARLQAYIRGMHAGARIARRKARREVSVHNAQSTVHREGVACGD